MPPGHASSPLTVVSVCSCLPANTFMSGQEEGNGVFDDTHLKMSWAQMGCSQNLSSFGQRWNTRCVFAQLQYARVVFRKLSFKECSQQVVFTDLYFSQTNCFFPLLPSYYICELFSFCSFNYPASHHFCWPQTLQIPENCRVLMQKNKDVHAALWGTPESLQSISPNKIQQRPRKTGVEKGCGTLVA